MDSTTVVVAAIGGIPAIIAAAFAYRSSVRAASTTEQANVRAEALAATKVDAEAYERSQHFYEKLLAESDKHLDRLRQQVDSLNAQVDRVNARLAQEQDVSSVLREQVRALTTQVSSMGTTLAVLHDQMQIPPRAEDGKH
jgi:peptidoglycan hydrolase CwlO-like protein